jgi:hypothetical protein
MNRTSKDPFAGLARPRAPEELREQALRAAREAMNAPPVTLWERIWESPAARLALAASLAVLVAGHVWIGTLNGGPEGPVRYARLDTPGIDNGLGEVLALPRIRISPTPFD